VTPEGQFLPADATTRLGSLIARCDMCGVEWDMDMQPSRCVDGTHQWALRVA
jgi:hypothetical protein